MWPKKLCPKLQADGSLGQATFGELRRWLVAALPQA